MLVSDLSCSLSNIPNTVKTYSFTLSEERPAAIPESPCSHPTESVLQAPHTPTITISDTSSNSQKTTSSVVDAGTENGLCSSSDSSAYLNSFGDETLPRSLGIGSMESFTNGIMREFESNLRQLHQKSLSLPDVFGDSNSQASSYSVSTTSIVESSSKDDSSLMNDSRRCSTPSINPDLEYRLAVASDLSRTHALNGCNACSSFVDDVDRVGEAPSPDLSLSDEESSSNELMEDVGHVQRKRKAKRKNKLRR